MASVKPLYKTEITRDHKRSALETMFKTWKKQTNDYIRVGVFNPSTTCLDLDIAVEHGLIREDTKLVFFENFKYLGRRDYIEEINFRKTAFNHIPMVKRENVYFHFGDLERLQLGGALAQINAGKINFMFVDLCGSINREIAEWLFLNRYLIEKGSFQYYTISLQGTVRKNKRQDFRLSEEKKKWIKNDKGVKSFDVIKFGLEKEVTELEKEALIRWGFVCSHMLNTSNELDNIQNILYFGGTWQKMGIFHGRNMEIERNRWNYNVGILLSETKNFTYDIDEYGVDWKNSRKGRRIFTNSEKSLFREGNLPDNFVAKNPLKLYEYLEKNKNRKDLIYNCHKISQIVNTMYGSLYPIETQYNKYRNSTLSTSRSKQIINKYLLNKKIEVNGKEYILIEDRGHYCYVGAEEPMQMRFSF